MPIQTYKLKPEISKKINRAVTGLLRKNVLHKAAPADKLFESGFCMPIQNVPKRQLNSLKFGKPEGYRVFIQHANTVHAAVDFVYGKTGLKMTAIHQGQGLYTILVILNKLEKKYRSSKAPCYPELIYFLLAEGPYIRVTTGKKTTYFHSNKDRLGTISPDQLKKKIETIIKHHQE